MTMAAESPMRLITPSLLLNTGSGKQRSNARAGLRFLLLCVPALTYAPLTPAPICPEQYPLCYEDVYCHRCSEQCFPAAHGTADLVVRALGSSRVAAVGDTVIAAEVEDPQKSVGLEFDLDLVRRFAEVNPAVAAMVLSFHTKYRAPTLNLLRGAGSLPGIPTRATFELAVARERDKAQIAKSLLPLPAGRYLQVRWDARDLDSDTLEVTFFTEIVDGDLRVTQRTHPNVVMLVSKSTRAVLSLAQQ